VLYAIFVFLLWVVVLSAAAVIAARWAFPLPPLKGRRKSQFLPMSEKTDLGSAIAGYMKSAPPGTSGILPLTKGAEAFAARMLLTRVAQHSIDARYYIWQNDQTGLPLLEELRAAAARGVRVRLLVDDNGTDDLDSELAFLNALPNFEVRLFNPFTLRKPRLVCYLFDFARLNRRMHNKSFCIDGAATIIGGRNIGDIYFARDANVQYFDFDLLAVGPIVAEVARDFDAYWACDSAYPHERLVKPTPGFARTFAAEVEAATTGAEAEAYADALLATQLVSDLADDQLTFDWVPVTLHSDPPEKGLHWLPTKRLLVADLSRILAGVRESLDVVSAYFVPGHRGTRMLVRMARAGRTVRVLTNSLEATDVLPVHASYVKYRKPLLKGGVELFELKAAQADEEKAQLGILGESAASLHAKSFVIDHDRVFVGSFNFDPRSVLLNCEMGFLAQSPALVQVLEAAFSRKSSHAAWAVTLSEKRELQWSGHDSHGVLVTQDDEPGSTLKDRAAIAVISRLPVEWLM
jgi:cardiolipin synthase C